MARQKIKSIELIEPILVKTFGLNRVFEPTKLLKDWLLVDGILEKTDFDLLENVRSKLLENADSWNEEELKMQFISMMMFLTNVQKPVRTYYEREISANVEGVFVSCIADMLFSKGIGEMIETPYFFLHEYKREKKYSGDPIGQMLGGMLIGQAKNDNKKPMYGCYVQGRFWFFSILDGTYTISQSFDSSTAEGAKKILFILRKLLQIIKDTLMD
jgi:hypothetical protein